MNIDLDHESRVQRIRECMLAQGLCPSCYQPLLVQYKQEEGTICAECRAPIKDNREIKTTQGSAK